MSTDTTAKVIAIVNKVFPGESVTADTGFHDLGAEGTDLEDLAMEIDEAFGLSTLDDDTSGWGVVSDVIKYVEANQA